jgi:signal transduction histidine kinase
LRAAAGILGAAVERKRAEAARARVEQLQELDRLKDDLIANVSHELRTPLTSILGRTERLVSRDLDVQTRSRYHVVIHAEAGRLKRLVDDLLDLRRIEQGRFRPDSRPVDLAPLLVEEVELYAHQSAAHRIELQLPREPLLVLAERERIEQVVGNLLSNAIKYSPGGGPVEVLAEAHDGAIRVCVLDRGLGIPVGDRDRVFSRFFRVDTTDTRRIGGTGLGLALCREIVEAHGGRMGFDSVEGHGSRFWFELPRVEAPTEVEVP